MLIKITRELIEIPSFPQTRGGESELASFISRTLEQVKGLRFERQPVEKKRYNLIVSDGSPIKIIFCCHLDTVLPKQNQLQNSRPVSNLREDQLWGLGACDMKGGIGALLSVLLASKRTFGLTIIFYCDEEFDFLGMKNLIKNNHFIAPLAIFTEPTDLKIANGCRGLIQIEGLVYGKTAHAALPEQGQNAIINATKAFLGLRKRVSLFRNKTLGRSVCNLAALEGGLLTVKKSDGTPNIARVGNNVPDIAKVLLECRTASKNLDLEKFVNLFSEAVIKNGSTLALTREDHSLGCMLTEREELVGVEEAIIEAGLPVEYADATQAGYYDAQMFSEAFNIPCISFGPGPANTSHTADEYVSVESLKKTAEVYKSILKKFGVLR